MAHQFNAYQLVAAAYVCADIIPTRRRQRYVKRHYATQSNIKFILGEDKVNAFIQNTIAIKLENAENGRITVGVKICRAKRVCFKQNSGIGFLKDYTEYTLPEVTNNVVDLFGNRVEKDVTVSVKDAEGNNLRLLQAKFRYRLSEGLFYSLR